MDRTYDVFISYSAVDEEVARTICDALEQDQNISCWVGYRNARPARDWITEIMHGIKRCRTFLLILTSRSSASNMVEREILKAVQLSLPIFCVRTDDTPLRENLDFLLGSWGWLKIALPIDSHLPAIAQTVRELLGGDVGSAVPHTPHEQAAPRSTAPGTKAKTFEEMLGRRLREHEIRSAPNHAQPAAASALADGESRRVEQDIRQVDEVFRATSVCTSSAELGDADTAEPGSPSVSWNSESDRQEELVPSLVAADAGSRREDGTSSLAFETGLEQSAAPAPDFCGNPDAGAAPPPADVRPDPACVEAVPGRAVSRKRRVLLALLIISVLLLLLVVVASQR